jgi:hypothetical protein
VTALTLARARLYKRMVNRLDMQKGINKSARCSVFVLLAILCLEAPKETKAQAFEGEGTITYQIDRSSIHKATTKRFAISRQENQWRIKTFNEDPSCATCSNSPVAYFEAGGDGTNVFFLEQDDLEKLKKMASRDFNSPNFVSARATVTVGLVPPNDINVNLINFVWQAYASSPYYVSLTNNIAVSPLFSIADRYPAFSIPVRWSAGPDTNFLSDIVWQSGGWYLVSDRDDNVTTNRYSGIYSNGFEQAHFQVLTWTNLDGTTVPESFSLVKFDPKPPVDGNPSFSEGFHVTGHLEWIRPLKAFSYLPEITSKTLVKDVRYSNLTHYRDPVGYVTSSHWYTEGEIKDYLHGLGVVNNAPIHPIARRWFVLAGMLIITTGFAVALMIGRKTKTAQ